MRFLLQKAEGILHDPKDLKITADIMYIGTAYSVRDESKVQEKNRK
jgi:hypothetical protein